MRRSRIADQDFIIHDQALLFRFFQRPFECFGQTFEVIVGHSIFGFDHGDLPDRTFGVRRIALRARDTAEHDCYCESEC